MTSAESSYNLQKVANVKELVVKEIISLPVYYYLDVDSTYRNRTNYPSQANFVLPMNLTKGSTSSTAYDPVVLATPYSGSTAGVGNTKTQVSADASHITLDATEPSIDNFYINSVLEISGAFRTITAYNGTTKVATVSVAFGSTPANGTSYNTRRGIPFFVGSVAASPAPTTTSFALNAAASTVDNFYTGSFLRFTSGVNSGNSYLITKYVGSTQVVTINTTLTTAPSSGDTLEISSFSQDNANSVYYTSGNVINTSQPSYYEVELLYLTLPNQTLNAGYGGVFNNYPYVYVQLYNESGALATQVFYSDNPFSAKALFKVPIDNYNGITSFYNLIHSRTRQTIRIFPTQDLRFRITLPDGSIVSFSTSDTTSPVLPNPLLQINALFSFRKVVI